MKGGGGGGRFFACSIELQLALISYVYLCSIFIIFASLSSASFVCLFRDWNLVSSVEHLPWAYFNGGGNNAFFSLGKFVVGLETGEWH